MKMNPCPVLGGYFILLALPAGAQEFKFVADNGTWVTSEAYPTVQSGDANNSIMVHPAFQQAARFAWWIGLLTITDLANRCMDAAYTIASATVAITAVSTTVVKPIVAPLIAGQVRSTVKQFLPRSSGNQWHRIVLKASHSWSTDLVPSLLCERVHNAFNVVLVDPNVFPSV